MKITDYIRKFFSTDNHVLTYKRNGYIPGLELTKYKFGETIYLNIAEIKTSLYNEVVWTTANDTPKYKAWKAFVDKNGYRILTQLLTSHSGFCVVGYDSELDEVTGQERWRFYELPASEYHIESNAEAVSVVCNNPAQRYYVLKDETLEVCGRSTRDMSDGFVKMIDAVMNGATTTAERLGAYVVMSPKQDNFGGVLLEGDKEDLEKEMQREYGMLSKQKQIMLLPRPMDAQIVSLASVDTKMNDKLRSAVLAIADRLKVPANQIALIDGGQSKSFANGTEYREGDLAKYRSFRRMLNATLYDMAVELGLRVDYAIENEPQSVQGQKIESNE